MPAITSSTPRIPITITPGRCSHSQSYRLYDIHRYRSTSPLRMNPISSGGRGMPVRFITQPSSPKATKKTRSAQCRVSCQAPIITITMITGAR